MRRYDKFQEIKNLIDNRKFTEALEQLEDLYKINPGNRFIEFEIAKIKARSLSTVEEAKQILENLLSQPNATHALYELAKIESEQGNISKARSYYKKIISREDETTRAIFELADLEYHARCYNEAKKYVEIILNREEGKMYYHGLIQLAKIEKQLNNIDLARNYLEKVLNEEKAEENVKVWAKLELSKLEIIDNNREKAQMLLTQLIDSKISSTALVVLINIEIKDRNYEQAFAYYQLLEKSPNYIKTKHTTQMGSFLKYKLGLITPNNYPTPYYFLSQLFNYDEEMAIEHIKLHSDKVDDKFLHSVYSDSIDIDELYAYAKEKIQNLDANIYGYNDQYIIRCNKVIGETIENKSTDTLKIVTLSNTKNILTMYPIPAINNELHIEKEKIKTKEIKRISQIDKFNRRYGKNSY